jgi:hypothetical protein
VNEMKVHGSNSSITSSWHRLIVVENGIILILITNRFNLNSNFFSDYAAVAELILLSIRAFSYLFIHFSKFHLFIFFHFFLSAPRPRRRSLINDQQIILSSIVTHNEKWMRLKEFKNINNVLLRQRSYRK